MPTAYIVAARRTPIGKFMGGLAKVPAPVLGSYVAKAMFADCPGAAAHVDECVMGNVLQAGVGQNPARQVALLSGLPETISAVTVNKVCGSGLEAVMQAARSIRAGDNHVVLAGGIENMDLAPHMMQMRGGVKYGPATMQDHMAADGLTCAFEKWAMGCAADFIATKHEVSRAEQDRFSAQSHQRAAAATAAGHFKAEIVALSPEKRFDGPASTVGAVSWEAARAMLADPRLLCLRLRRCDVDNIPGHNLASLEK
jgi:acetyl-CoA C-acetyltransferase